MVIKEFPGKKPNVGNQGFSLVELMVVVFILGILSVTVGVQINSAKTKLKTFVFNTKTRFYQAKFEAIKTGRDVYLDFDFNNDGSVSNDHGFTIWMDENGDGNYVTGDGDVIVGTPVTFDNQATRGRHGPEIYRGDGVYPYGGPKDPNGGPNGLEITDGVTGPGDRFLFKANGDSSAGTVYFYFPQGPIAAKEVRSGPFAIIVNAVGRVRVVEWTQGWNS